MFVLKRTALSALCLSLILPCTAHALADETSAAPAEAATPPAQRQALRDAANLAMTQALDAADKAIAELAGQANPETLAALQAALKMHGKNMDTALDERLHLAQAALHDCANVKAVPFDGLIVDFVRAQQAQVIVRGLRSVTDYDYETQMSGMNRHLAPDVDTVFLHTSANVQHISSTLVREIAKLGGDVSGLVSAPVHNALTFKMSGVD